MKLNELKQKKVLILGFGREGQDTFRFLRRMFPKKVIGIADRNRKIKNQKSKVKNVRWHLGENYLKALKDYDVIIKSPGIPFKILPKSALPKITTQTEIFFDNWPPEQGEAERRVKMKANSAGGKLHRQGSIVGITGTKGKSTTSSLIYEILKNGGKNAYLIGNIEKPVLSYLAKAKPEDIFVYELSSHQLYSLKKSPHIAVFLNIYPEHLDYYRNFKEYANAKANITRHQTKNDYLVYNAGNKIVREIAEKSKAKKIILNPSCLTSNVKHRASAESEGEEENEVLFFAKGIPAINVAAAIAVARIFKIPEKEISKAIKKFKPLPHRLELVGTFKGITFYNDALATIPEATILAMDALGDNVQTIMLGGFERNIDFKNLAKRVLKSRIKNVILFPTTGKKIWRKILQQAKINHQQGVSSLGHFFADDMEKAVKIAYNNTERGKICLLSTASSSFSIFKDYKEKGNLFKKFVKRYAKEKHPF